MHVPSEYTLDKYVVYIHTQIYGCVRKHNDCLNTKSTSKCVLIGKENEVQFNTILKIDN